MADSIVYRQRRRGKDGAIRMVSEIVRRVPTQDELRARYHYNPDTGVFTHLQKRGKHRPGDIAGGRNLTGYWEMRVMNRLFVAHRLAFLYMTGKFPVAPITVDHINGVTDDNRWCNLRLATREQQTWNSVVHSRNKSALKGAWPCKTTGRWQSILCNGKDRIWLGRFDTAEAAHDAWIKAAVHLRGEKWMLRAKRKAA